MILNWLDRLFNEHKFVRRFLVFWALAIISITIGVFLFVLTTSAASISAPVATIISAILAMLTTVLGFYQWSRGNDDKTIGPEYMDWAKKQGSGNTEVNIK